jgi:tRNA(adenine34) deaminase
MLNPDSNSDLAMMQRCIALAADACVNDGEYPFAAVIASKGAFLCESANRANRDRDVNSHAEIVALSKAQLIRGADLSDCTMYATVEPCAQCSYAIREARIGKFVYGLRSPVMGGHSRWNILSDMKLSTVLPEVFLPAPEIVSGFLQNESEGIFHSWNPFIWQVSRREAYLWASPRKPRPLLRNSLRNIDIVASAACAILRSKSVIRERIRIRERGS